MSGRSNGPAPEPWATRGLALAALAGAIGLAHSMIVPVYTSVDARIADQLRSGEAQTDGSQGVSETSDTDVPGPVVVEDESELEVIEVEPSIPITAPPVVVSSQPDAGLSSGLNIELDEALAKWDEGALFLDARREDEFNVSRIAGAFFMPSRLVYESNALLSGFIGQPVVIYCVGGDCDASKNTMARLLDIGFDARDISIMTASYTDWAQAGYPTEEGTP
ncbi:MAG: rhodanese-like domain-containing protein [Planctomycetota bacterium]